MIWKVTKKNGGPITMRYSVGSKVAVVTETATNNGTQWGANVWYSEASHTSMLIGPLFATSTAAVNWCEQYLANLETNQ